MSVGDMKILPGVYDFRKLYAHHAVSYVNLFRPEWAPAGTVCIGIKGIAADVVSLWDPPGPGRDLVTAPDLPGATEKCRQTRLWRPEHAEGGNYYFRYMDTNLFLAISADGYPTLLETPAPWRIDPVDLTAF